MILIVSTCGEVLSELEFVRPLEKIAGNCLVKHCSKVRNKDVLNARKIIISGTALQDFEYLSADFSWLLNCEKPVLGICAGMQAIAKAFGIELEKKLTIGVKPVEVNSENKLADGKFNAYFLHTLTGAGDFEVLAKSEGVPCMVKHPEKEIYGCIFHPEVMNEQIIRNFLK